MDEEHFENEELQFQHFGVSSTKFCSDFKTEVEIVIKIVLDALEEKLISIGILDENVIRQEIKLIFNEYIAMRDEVMLVAEEKIKEFFTIPKTAKPYLNWKQHFDTNIEENVEELEKKLQELEQEYLREQTFQHLCNEELEKLNSFDAVFEKMDKILKEKFDVTDKSISPKIEKLLTFYNKYISKLNLVPDDMPSIVEHYNFYN